MLIIYKWGINSLKNGTSNVIETLNLRVESTCEWGPKLSYSKIISKHTTVKYLFDINSFEIISVFGL